MTHPGRASARAEQNALRLGMLDAGMTTAEIADEFIRRYRYRPRAAFRHAHGWTLLRAADHINSDAARLHLDPDGRAPMTAPYLCELEHWPYPAERRRLTPQILALLATVYETDVHSLLDVDDRMRLRPADRLVIDAMVCDGMSACGCGRSRERVVEMSRVPGARLEELASAGSMLNAPVPRRDDDRAVMRVISDTNY